jgi:hypothetical protein
VPLTTIRHAIQADQYVTRAERIQRISSGSIDKGTPSGETIYLGSPQSQTLLRVYDKRLESQAKQREDWQDYGIRWELELKKDRAQVCGQVLSYLEEADCSNSWSVDFGPMSISEIQPEMRKTSSGIGVRSSTGGCCSPRLQERPSHCGERGLASGHTFVASSRRQCRTGSYRRVESISS